MLKKKSLKPTKFKIEMAGNSNHFIYDMADFESARGRTSKFSNFLCRDAFQGQRRPYSNECGSVQKFKARLIHTYRVPHD